MKSLFTLLLFIAFSTISFGQNKMIVFLKDKGNQQIEQSNFTERSIQRRLKNQSVFDSRDIAVNPDYITALAESGEVLNVSRWLNAVSYESDLSVEELMAQYPFIERAHSVGRAHNSLGVFEEEGKTVEYGMGVDQVDQINLICMHDQDYTGEGIFMAVIDVGFRNMDTIQYFDSVYLENRLIDVHNFVTGQSDVYDYSGHGTSVSSCIVAEKSGVDPFAGTAFDVDLALYVSEDFASETEIEEFNLVVALERCDSVGVEIANISLGYYHFDDSTTSHVYADMDGQTTIAAQGVNVAASKGIAVITSAGNGGPDTISTPCDADSCLCIGAVDGNGAYATFSSVGPSADGQVKPDVSARGQWAVLVASNGTLTASNGTSFSSPIIAGATACLMQANPSKTVMEIFDAIRQSANQFNTPDEFLGYGIPDFCAANDLLASMEVLENDLIEIYPNPADGSITVTLKETQSITSIELVNMLGQIVIAKSSELSDVVQLDVHALSNGMYTVQVHANGEVFTKKLVIRH
ncbi:MAG: S8/S53 family peptidase [Crocinitomicaceae bacterium]|nr:S8/S53 family peptidase [Crocinitomicaceae bacterium]